jgi:hypothetical protein
MTKALHDAQLATPKIMIRRLRADVKRMIEPKPIPRENDDYSVMRLDIGDVADAVATSREGHRKPRSGAARATPPQGVFTSNFPIRRKASLNAAGTLSKLPVPVALA